MTMTGVSELFVDINILIYLSDGLSPWYRLATDTIEDARQLGVEVIVSTQILREYLAASTRLNAQGRGLPTADVLANLQTFETNFKVVEDNRAVLSALVSLVQNNSVSGRQVYDANIVATMQINNIGHLLTHNVADFTRFAGLITVMPLVVQTP